MIYFIQAGENGPIKVGKSVNTESRLKSHQSSHYEELRVIQQVPGYSERESEILKDLQKYNIRGEWFEPSSEVFEYIRKIKHTEYENEAGRSFAVLYRETETSKTEMCPFDVTPEN